ncbi:MAG: CapA family protein [Myxococcota bacterium]
MIPLLLALAFALACEQPPPPEPTPAPAPLPEASPTLALPQDVGTVHVRAVGDFLITLRLKKTARGKANGDNHGGFDWIWAPVAPMLRDADLTFANLETPVAPDHHRGIVWEVFNAPADLIPSMAHAGVDVVSFANNHTFDQGPAGILETLQRLDDAGIASAGSGPTCADAAAPARLEVNGVRVAVLAATDLMNLDERDGADAPCTFVAGPVCTTRCGPDRDAIHYAIDEARLKAAIEAARDDADAVVMSFHWGDEYRTQPLPVYTDLAPKLIEWGVDVVLGHHPHVLQPITQHTADDGRQGLIVYSMGNFVSDMGSKFDPKTSAVRRGNTRDGVIIDFNLIKTRLPGGRTVTRVADVSAIPLWTTNNRLTRRAGEPDEVQVISHEQSDDPGLMAVRRAQVARVIGAAWLSPAGAEEPPGSEAPR